MYELLLFISLFTRTLYERCAFAQVLVHQSMSLSYRACVQLSFAAKDVIVFANLH